MELEKHLGAALSLTPSLEAVSGAVVPREFAAELEWLRQRRVVALTRNYFVVEPLCLYVPILCARRLRQVLVRIHTCV